MDLYGPLCVGLDPHPGLLVAWGLTDDAAGLREFARRVLDAVGGRVAAIKPQSALFERHGSAGVAVLEEIVAAGREAGTLVIVDAKRGDIGSTMAAYADAYLRDGSPLAGDALTVSPFLGFGSLAPAIDTALATGRGLFVLALTSNPEGASVQHALTPPALHPPATQTPPAPTPPAPQSPSAGVSSLQAGSQEPIDRTRRAAQGRSVAGVIADAAGVLNAAELGARGGTLGSIGLVVGATIGDAAVRLGIDLAAVRGPLLAPGVGAQGAGPDELAAVFGSARRAVLASSSRAVLAAGPDVANLRAAARRAADDASAALR
ncbi:orotidine-5'-phosphate decarboxylase [Pengzhenrongella frigida]|uniref:Orotidine-5'-phosphate decarboxylase n=2 Tax=Pengzhenrongella frigida TaxID=1259133 RepID=A0A4Q5N5R5_9MICO|nr:orotidine-5'-phosphate decarboxylase [Cellulomonas sp. HLT2-17]